MLTEHNDQLFAEFTRITGSTCRFAFVPWIADKQRDAMRFTAFDACKRDRQHAELLEHLQSLPTRGSE